MTVHIEKKKTIIHIMSFYYHVKNNIHETRTIKLSTVIGVNQFLIAILNVNRCEINVFCKYILQTKSFF